MFVSASASEMMMRLFDPGWPPYRKTIKQQPLNIVLRWITLNLVGKWKRDV